MALFEPKKGKTLILFLLILIVSIYVLTCFSILYTTKEVAANMRTAVGAAFHIRSSQGIELQGTELTQQKQVVITEQAINQIMKNDNLKYYNGRNSGYAKGLQFVPGAYHNDDNNMGQVSANNYTALNSNFGDKVLELIEGRHITPSDENVVIISETLAELNGLSVGDEISFSPAELAQDGQDFIDAIRDSNTTAKAQIIGIFTELEPQGNAEFQPTAGLRSNLIFSDHTLLSDLGEAKEGEYSGGVSFYIGDPLYLNEIVDEVRKTDLIDWDSYFIRKDDFNFEKISSGLQTIQNLVKTLLVCVSIVSVAVLILILAMRMRGRVREAGVLMSVGVSKKEILGQFLAEVVIVAIIAFAFSYFAAGFVSSRVESGIIENLQVVQIEEQELKTGLTDNSTPTALLSTPTVTTVIIYVSLLIVIVLSACLSSLAIIKLKPREIFSKIE